MSKRFSITQGQTDLPPATLLNSKKKPQNISGNTAVTFSMWTVDFSGLPRTNIFSDEPVTVADVNVGVVNWPDAFPADIPPGTYGCQWTVTFASGKRKPYPSADVILLVVRSKREG